MKDLLEKYLAAKAAEALAIEARVQIGNEIAAKLGAPTEGSQTHEVDGYRVTVKQPVNRKVDWRLLDEIEMEPGQDKPIETKRELSVPGLRWYQANRPDVYEKLAKAITATPGRVAVEIKPTGEK